jgi:aminoglycoside phosphotransferase (APT) family kinase protein
MAHPSDPAASSINAEAGLLAAVADISPLPVPEPLFTDPGQGCWAYAKLPGVPLLNLPLPQRLARAPLVAAALGRFLAALHAAPPGQMARLVDPGEVPMAEHLHRQEPGRAAVAVPGIVS